MVPSDRASMMARRESTARRSIVRGTISPGLPAHDGRRRRSSIGDGLRRFSEAGEGLLKLVSKNGGQIHPDLLAAQAPTPVEPGSPAIAEGQARNAAHDYD